MALELGWIDFSEKDRKKAIDVIHLLEGKGTVDELGIGIVRDAFANMFFPGTSTVQTRAKYFFVIPYIIKECCEDKRNKTIDSIYRAIDQREKECAINMKASGETDGVIGADVIPDKWVVRKPYSIYWNGIKKFGIFTRPYMSLREYIHYMLRHREDGNLSNWTTDGEENEQDDKKAGTNENDPFWNLPPNYNQQWYKDLHIALSKEEAKHLRKRITSLDDCLLKSVIDCNLPLSKYVKEKEPFRYLYNIIKNDNRFNDTIKQAMLMAIRFDSLVYLSIVLYNRMLSNEQNDEATKEWKDLYKTRLSEINSLNLDDLFLLTDIKDRRTMKFLKEIQGYLISGDIDLAKESIYQREVELKDITRSKLANRTSQPTDKWIGGHHLDYRMTISARLINDIYNAEGINNA